MTFLSCTPTSQGKEFHTFLVTKLTPMDPAQMSDLYTNTLYGNIAEALFEYNYVNDNYVLQPLLAESMPVVSADNLTYTFKIRQDAYYYDSLHEVFEDNERLVMAKDILFALKRLADPKTQANGYWLLENRIVGLDEWAKNGADYNAEIPGLKIIDDFTFEIKLTAIYPQVLYVFATNYTAPLPEELLDFYGENFIDYPTGSGAYYLNHDETITDSVYILDKNPTWHGQNFPSKDEFGSKVAAKLGSDVVDKYAGQALPFMDRIVVDIIEESSVQWLKFLSGDLDSSGIPKDNFDSAIVQGSLTPEMVERGITLDINSTLDITWTHFNLDDPIFQNRKLRQALSMAYDRTKLIEVFYNGRAMAAQTVIPPGTSGYDPDYINPYGVFDLEGAKELLAEAGYPNGEGLPVFKRQLYSGSTTAIQFFEYLQSSWAAIGVRVESIPGDWPTYMEAVDSGQVQVGGHAWSADYPDGQNFLQLLYGPNRAPGPNPGNYNNPEFNALYEQAMTLQAGPEKDAIYAKAAQLAAEDAAWILGVHRSSYVLEQPWFKNRVFRDIGRGYYKYYDVDTEERNNYKKNGR